GGVGRDRLIRDGVELDLFGLNLTAGRDVLGGHEHLAGGELRPDAVRFAHLEIHQGTDDEGECDAGPDEDEAEALPVHPQSPTFPDPGLHPTDRSAPDYTSAPVPGQSLT